MNTAEDWGSERSAWLADLSYGTAITASVLLLAGLMFLFRVPLLRLVAPWFRPFAPLLTLIKIIIAFTPLRDPLRRYLYVGRHLQTA